MHSRILCQRDLINGTVIAIFMAIVFTVAGGLPLVITFVPGVILSWLIFLRMFLKKTEFPKAESFYPFYFAALAWQFLHFNEEFLTGFYRLFPQLFGSAPYSIEFFVSINMISYFLFAITAILTFTKNLKFLVIPGLFFIIYGGIGNAISHTWWVIWQKSYFPGFYTGLGYWIIGPLVLSKLIGSKKDALITVAVFAVILVPLLSIFMQAK